MAETCLHENNGRIGSHVPPLLLQSPVFRIKERCHQSRHRLLRQYAHNHPHSQRLGNQIRRPLRTHVCPLQTPIHRHCYRTTNRHRPHRSHQNSHHIHNCH